MSGQFAIVRFLCGRAILWLGTETLLQIASTAGATPFQSKFHPHLCEGPNFFQEQQGIGTHPRISLTLCEVSQ
eukprot:6486142-Amphidinium_carterae.2